MAERNLLHKNKLDLLKWWLSSKGYEIQATKNIYEVLRASNGEDTIIIFKQSGAREHLTVQDKDYKLIRQFIRETRKPKEPHKKPITNYDRIRNMSVEELAEFMYSAPDKICFENCTRDTGNKFSCKFGEGVDTTNCINCMKKYLESEVEGETDG